MPASCPWGQRHNCTFGMKLEYTHVEPDDIIVPRQLRNTLYDDRECLTIHQYKRRHRNWKNNRSTQWTKPEASAKIIMSDLVATDDAS